MHRPRALGPRRSLRDTSSSRSSVARFEGQVAFSRARRHDNAPNDTAVGAFDALRCPSPRRSPGSFPTARGSGRPALRRSRCSPMACSQCLPTCHAWPGDPHRLVGCACGDPAQQAWYLGWAPWALFHGHNPLFTNWMEYPQGVNLAANTEMPLLGLITAPISYVWGSVSSFSLLLWLSYPISASSCFFVLRRWTRSNLGGKRGLLYGFSAFVVAQGLGHLNLCFVPLPPLIFLALYEVLVDQKVAAAKVGNRPRVALERPVPHLARGTDHDRPGRDLWLAGAGNSRFSRHRSRKGRDGRARAHSSLGDFGRHPRIPDLFPAGWSLEHPRSGTKAS